MSSFFFSLIVFALYVAYYIISSRAWRRIAKLEQIRWSWVAWIPFIGSNFIIARLAKWKHWWVYPSLFAVSFILMMSKQVIFLQVAEVALGFVFVIQITQLLNRWGFRANLVMVLVINSIIELYILSVPTGSFAYMLMLDVVMVLNLWFAIFLNQLSKFMTAQEEDQNVKRSA